MYKNIFAKLRWQVPAQLSRRHARHLRSGCNTHLGWWTACCVSAPAAPSPPPCSGTGWAASPCRRGSARDLRTNCCISCYNQTYIPYSCHNQTERCFMSSPLFNCSNELWSGNEIGKSADMVSFQLFNFWWNNRKIYFHQCFLQLLVITVTSCPLSKLPRLINRWHWFAALPPTNLLGLIVQKETNNK